MKYTKIVVANTLYQVFGKIAISGMGVIATIFLSRYLGAKGYGEYSVVFAFASVASLFADFGFATLLTRAHAFKKVSKSYFTAIFYLRLYISSIVLLISCGLIFFFPYSYIVQISVCIATFGSLFMLLSSLYWALFQAEFTFDKMIITQIFTAFVVASLTIIGVFIHVSLLYFIIISAVGSFCGFIACLVLHKNMLVKHYWSKKVNIKILRTAFPMGIGAIVSVLYFKVDALMLAWFFNPTYTPDVGLYSLSYKVLEVFIVFGGYFTQTLFPFFSKKFYHSDFKQNFIHYFFWCLCISGFLTLIMYFFNVPLILLLGGKIFFPSIESVRILSLALGITILNGFFLNIAIAGNKQVFLMWCSFAAVCLNIALNILILPRYSFIGASWTTVLTQAFILVTTILASVYSISGRKVMR